MPPEPTQSDDAFVAACGFASGSAEADLALALRKNFGEYGRIDPQTVFAEVTVFDSGVFRPTDSIDLLDYTLMLEHITGVKFEPEQVLQQMASERENLLVSEWVNRVVSLVSAKGGITNRCS